MSIDALARALEDEDAGVKLRALITLGGTGRRAARHAPKIAALLEQPSMPLRVFALEALASIGDRRLASRMQPLQGDDDPVVREAATRAIRQLQQ